MPALTQDRLFNLRKELKLWKAKRANCIKNYENALADENDDLELYDASDYFLQSSMIDHKQTQQTWTTRISECDEKIADLEYEIESLTPTTPTLTPPRLMPKQQEQGPAKSDSSQPDSWNDFSVVMISEEKCRIETSDGKKRYTFAQLGMADGRKVNEPTKLWKLMQIFAATGGYINWKTIKAYSDGRDSEKLDFSSLTKQLNKHLQQHFGITDSIFTGHYNKTRGWRTKIKFSDERQMQPLK